MRTILSFFLIFSAVLCVSCSPSRTVVELPGPPRVVLGDEQFEEYVPLLFGKKVALFSNQSGIVGDKIIRADGTVQWGGFTRENAGGADDPTLIPFGRDADGNAVRYGEHVLDALLARGVDVAMVLSPEHGFRGTEDAGAAVPASVDGKTGVPVVPLYRRGAERIPTDGFDTLVVDVQDVGVRFYTYHIALFHLMDACAAAGKPVIILDRPNPNGFCVDGAILRKGYESGVGALPIPMVHGMTLGELGRMMNGEGWLSAGKNACDLTVVPCKNYSHKTMYALARSPSPNLKDMRSVYLYPSLCLFENTIVSVARGTPFPFEVYGSPRFEGTAGNDFSFVPESVPGARNPPFLGETCWGVDARKRPVEEILRGGIDLSYLLGAYRTAAEAGLAGLFFGAGDTSGRRWIDLLSGSDFLRSRVEAGASAEEIKAAWREECERFKVARKPYLLYSEDDVRSDWQVDASFPGWISGANFSANNALSFRFFRGQGTATVSVSAECESFSLYINGHKIDTRPLTGGRTYELDISRCTRNGTNVLHVSDIRPEGARNAVRVLVPYPVVRRGSLRESGIDPSAFSLIDAIVRSDIRSGFSTAQLAVVKDGALVYENAWGDGVTRGTLYDLASVTKMFSVSYAVQSLVSQRRLDLDARIVDILGAEFADDTISVPFADSPAVPLETVKEWKRRVTVRDVMTHTAGFAAGYAYFNDNVDLATGAFNVGENRNPLFSGFDAGEETRRRTLAQLFRTPLVSEPGTRLVYSDIGFMLLGFVVERVSGMRLDRFLRATFWEPLSLSRMAYRPLDNGFSREDCAPTDPAGNSCAGLISFSGVRTGEIRGEVHDGNAHYAMAGISGHAGLFANAADAARLASVMLTGGYGRNSFFTRNVVDAFTAPQSVPFADYGLGWWRQGEFQTVRQFGTLCSSGAFGHQGFTGTLVFVEPEQNLVVVYLTNKINSPMVAGEELSNQFTGNFYQSAVLGTIPQIILMGLGGNVRNAQWKSLVRDMAADARRRAEREAFGDADDARWKAYESLMRVCAEL